MSGDMAAALAGLKRARVPTSPGGPSEPPARIPSSPGGPSEPPARIPSSPAIDIASAAPASTAPARAATSPGNQVVQVGGGAGGVPVRTLQIAAGVVGLIVVVGVVVRLAGGAALPVPQLPADAVRCDALIARGTELVCRATSTSLNGLLPRERRDRIARTRPVAKAAGFTQIVFEDDDRPWRIEPVDAPRELPRP
jgi:hypothetical protein